MTLIRGLVVDDIGTAVNIIQKRLKSVFGRTEWEISWSNATDAHEALDAVEDAAEPFDFAIVDYDLGGGTTSLEVIRELRQRSRDTFILVISGHGNENPTFQTKSRQAGATAAIIRSALESDGDGEWTWTGLTNKIRQHIQALRPAGGLTIVIPKNDLSIEQMLHAIGSPPTGEESTVARGERIVSSLMIMAFEPEFRIGQTTLTVSHLAQGRSGAHVLRVDHERRGEPPRSYVMKIGLGRRALDQERLLNRKAKEALPRDALIEVVDAMYEHQESGFAAIIARLESRAVTLAAWLTAEGDRHARPEEAARAAEILFGAHLAPLFGHWAYGEAPMTEVLNISAGLQLRVMDAVSRFEKVWSHDHGAAQADAAPLIKVLTEFASTRTVPAAEPTRVTGPVPHVYGFGDLHTGNILIQHADDTDVRQGEPVLVDASIYGPAHWAADAARLIVDIVLRVHTAGTNGMLWHGFGEFRGYAARLCRFAMGDADPRDATDAFVRHVLGNMPRLLHVEQLGMDEWDWHWQWHAALAKEFLRQGTHAEMAPPQAVLAMTAAADHLTRAAQLVDGIDHAGGDPNGPSPCAAFALGGTD